MEGRRGRRRRKVAASRTVATFSPAGAHPSKLRANAHGGNATTIVALAAFTIY